MSQSKKEMMNRALSAMTMNIGKAGVNDNVIEEIIISPYLDTKLVQMGIEKVLKSEKIENVTIRSSDIQIR